MATLESDARRRALFDLLLREEGLQPFPTLKIGRRKESYSIPLSFTQQQMWFLNELVPGNPFYNIPIALHLKGPLNVMALEQSLNEIVRRHETLRTTFVAVEGVPVQVIAPALTLPLPIVDLTVVPENERIAAARTRASAEAGWAFDLTKGPLLRFYLLQLGETEHVLLIASHHIVTDGLSWRVFFRELSILYEAFSAGKPSPLPELPIQYADFVRWQHDRLQGDVLEQHLSYWKKQLNRAPALLELPTDRPRPVAQSFRGKSQSIVLSSHLTENLRALSRQKKATLFMTMLASFQALLSRITEQEDIVVGSPIEGRNRPEVEGLIGLFINTLVLRTDLSGNPSFPELLGRVRDVVLGAFAYQEVPFEKLMGELRSTRSLDRNTLFQVMLNFRQVTAGENLKLSGLTVEKLSTPMGVAKFDLILSVIERPKSLSCSFTYNTDLFDATTILRMLGNFQELLEGIVANPDQRLSALPLLTKSERQQVLVEWNDTKIAFVPHRCIHELFQDQAEQIPEAHAVLFEEERLSYRQLNRKANQLAHHLQALGVGPGVLVGLYLERSPEMIVGILGILKAGGAYVPLDPNYSSERLALMLEDTKARVLLTQKKLLGALSKTIRPEESDPRIQNLSVVCLDSHWEFISQESEENPAVGVNAQDLAYVIYTSGSTGRPKGVEITHRALSNFVRHTGNALALRSDDRILQFASISFDTAVEEIFPCLTRGATLVLRTDCMIDSVSVFLQKCAEWVVTVLDLPTVYWHELTERLCSERLTIPEQLRLVIIGGEKAIPERLAQWQKAVGDRVRLLNTYGPTEATVVATMWEATGAGQAAESLQEVPIGRPISNVQTYILDRHFNPVTIGARGELYVGGAGLARDYLNCPDLTAETFIPDPYSREPGGRLYKTGDLARYLPNGDIEFLGRVDNQVKIRGFRIELGEIETVLAKHLAVRGSVVTEERECESEKPKSKTRTELSRSIANPKPDRRLVAYVVAKEGSAPTTSEFRSFLKEKLPEYMVPSAFVFLDSLPLTPNGKVDRRALPAPDQSRPELEKPFVRPRDTLELELTKVWENILGVKSIGVRDNFFELGGHSLLAVRLFAEIEKTIGMRLPLATIFQAQTIEQLAGSLRREEWSKSQSSLWSTCPSTVVPFQPNGSKPPLFWFNWGPWDFLLPRHLGSDQPVYGLQHQSQDGHRAFYTNIEEMAAHYITEIRTVQANGPYYLGGLCIGGMVAFEMAQQLQKQGEEVALLVLLDPTNPRSDKSSSSHENVPGLLSRISWFRNKVYRHLRELEPLEPQEKLDYALVRVQNRIMGLRAKISWMTRTFLCEAFGFPLPPSLRTHYIVSIYGRAVRAYLPQHYRGRVILLKTQGRYRSGQLRWGNLIAGGLEIQELDTDHDNVFKEPYVQTFAERLKARLSETQRSVTA